MIRVKGRESRGVAPTCCSRTDGNRGGAVPCSYYLYSGSAVVLVNDAAEDVTTNDDVTFGSGDRVGNRLGETQAAVWSRFVVVRDVFVEHRLKMSP